MFARFRALSSTLHWDTTDILAGDDEPGTITGPAGNPVDASCNKTVRVTLNVTGSIDADTRIIDHTILFTTTVQCR